MTPSCDRQQNRAVEEAPLGASSAVKKSSVPNSLSRGSDGSSGSRMGAEEQVMSEHASNGDAGSSSKKRRKRMDARSYIKKFKTGVRPGASGISSSHVGLLLYLLKGWMAPSSETNNFNGLCWFTYSVIKSHCNHQGCLVVRNS